MGSPPSHPAILVIALALLAAGCSSRSGREPSARAAGSDDAAAVTGYDAADGLACRRQGEAQVLALPEASGASYVAASGARPAHLLVVGDSGNHGAYVELDLQTGEVLASGRLPLDRGASDDLEGLSVVGGTVYGITSSGWMRHWRRRTDGGYDLTVPAYPIASPAARPSPGGRLGRLAGPALVCRNPRDVNCASNYEGLCLRYDEIPDGDCAGFAAAKETGLLHCLVRGDEGRLSVDPARALRVARPQLLTGCHFAPEGDLLWTGENAFGGSSVSRIRGWAHPEQARIERQLGIGSGFPEAIAVTPGGLLYRFSDTARAPSLVDKYICE